MPYIGKVGERIRVNCLKTGTLDREEMLAWKILEKAFICKRAYRHSVAALGLKLEPM